MVKKILGFFFVSFSVFLMAAFVNPKKDDVVFSQKMGVAWLQNKSISISFNLKTGTYDIWDKTENKKVVSLATYKVEQFSSADTYKRKATVEDIADEFGPGRKMTILCEFTDKPSLILGFTLYNTENFVNISWGFFNKTTDDIRIKKAQVLSGTGYENSIFTDYMVLDGESNDFQTKVLQADTLQCKNNLMATWGKKGGSKKSVVIGGLTYHEFEKYARVIKTPLGLQFDLWVDDPVGKLVDKGSEYKSEDKFYLDFTTKGRFEILEKYGKILAKANKVDISGVDFPILNFWYAYTKNFGADEFKNTSVGTVEMLKKANETGFNKYAKIGIRLEPDDYSEPNNQQGWWDDKHWQMYENGQLVAPLETMEKWAAAIKNEGGEPLIYFQTARRSKDYAIANPGHMLFNETHKKRSKGMGGWWKDGNQFWGYDFTDPDFVAHMRDVYSYLKKSGIKGIKYDYPLTGWAYDGGFEDKHATTAFAYRNIYKLAFEGLGPGRDIHERMGPSDITLGVITTQRTEGDNDIVIPPMTAKTGLRWYKNRVVYHCDQDARNPFRAHPQPVRYAWQSMYTMTYITSGRMEIGKYFHKMTDEMLYDLSRVIPLHQAPQSARPIDAFSGKNFPEVYDFMVNPDWHLLTFYNTRWTGDKWPEKWNDRLKKFPGEMIPGTVSVDLSASTDDGGLALNPNDIYYIWDFWNYKLAGKLQGNTQLSQEMLAGEARMFAIHKVQKYPQFISTNRHIMQGYLDLTVKPNWENQKRVLSGESAVPAGEDYKIVIATNKYPPASVGASSGKVEWQWLIEAEGILELIIRCDKNEQVKWWIDFSTL